MTAEENAGHATATALALQQQDEAAAQAVVVAQGNGAAATRMLAAARELDIPVLEDFALSRALVPLPRGTTIPDPLFKALAALLSYISEQQDLLSSDGSPKQDKHGSLSRQLER